MESDTLPVEYFDSFAAELMSKFKRLNKLDVDHKLSEGTYHEEIIRHVLKNFLSKRYSVKTGFIYKDGKHSKQIDILIIDESSPAAYYFQEGEFAVVMPEAVVAFIEVKTTLNTDSFPEAIRNIVSAKQLMKSTLNNCGAIVGFQSSSSSKEPDKRALGRMFRKLSTAEVESADNHFYGPDAIIFLENNLSMFRYVKGVNTINLSKGYHTFKNPSGSKGWQLSVLLGLIINASQEKEQSEHAVRLLNSSNEIANRFIGLLPLEIGEDRYVLGRGIVEPVEQAAL